MVSIKDVARIAGVSTATVSRAIATPDKVSIKSRQRVNKAIEQTGYVTNTLARNFRRRRTNMVLVLIPDICNPFFAEVIKGIEHTAHKHDYHVLLGDTQYDPNSEKAYAQLIAQRQADGIITLGERIPFDHKKGLSEVDPQWPPLAMACEYHESIPLPTVCIDNFQASFEAISHLTQLGHRHIAYINGPSHSPICEDRLKGYQQAMQAIHIKPQSEWIEEGNFSMASGEQAMKRLLKLDTPPTAVFAANDEMAIGAMSAIKAQGLNIPKDISVIGFDDIDYAQYSDPPLTTIRQPTHLLGENVMQQMLSLLENNSVDEQHIVLEHKLIVRASTSANKQTNTKL